MTNTHINVGGHKITTNKVGQVHDITSLKTGFSGTLKWVVNNGICTVSIWSGGVSETAENRIIYDNLPKAKTDALAVIYAGSNFWGSWYIRQNESRIYVNNYAVSGMYASLTYPVADDWVES